MTPILLLRSPSQDNPDRYHTAFTESYAPISVSVLETANTNTDKLESIISSGPDAQSLIGVIITSQRACLAWRAAVQNTLNQDPGAGFHSKGLEAWGSVPFYVVGQGTAATLAEIQTLHKCTLDIRGSSSGTSERLARFIVNDLQPASTPAPVTGKLLYLIGDKNRDDLPNILHENNIKLLSLQVYKTQGSPALEQNLSEAISEPSKRNQKWWIVFFAPSSAEFATPVLQKFFEMYPTSSTPESVVVPRIAAIGPTTETFLRDTLGLCVHVVAAKPTAEQLNLAITAYDSTH